MWGHYLVLWSGFMLLLYACLLVYVALTENPKDKVRDRQDET